ncbi:hypothetical protein APHAL10511_008571 [Amanita phalloides]|nr:hypothetical protein APHAL10511_008571 [Amanita phalloides]
MVKPHKGKQKAEPGLSKEVVKATQGKKSKFKTKVTKNTKVEAEVEVDEAPPLGMPLDDWVGIGGCNSEDPPTNWSGINDSHIKDEDASSDWLGL